MSKTAAAKVDVAPKVELKKLPPGNEYFSIRESSFATCEADVMLPLGHTFEDTLRPEYWINHAHRLARRPVTNEPARVGAELVVRRQDHAFIFRLYVRAVLERGLIVAPIIPDSRGVCVLDTTGPSAMTSDQLDTQWSVAKSGWDVIRKSDNAVVADKFQTREMALEWIAKTTVKAA